MPLIHYLCECKHSIKKFYRQPKDAPNQIECFVCQCKATKTMSAPSSASKVVVDNGFQAKAVEINPDIVEINERRSNKDYSKEE